MAAILACQAGGAAQEPGPLPAAVGGACFRGRPLPACRSFAIVEMQGDVPLGRRERSTLEWNLGGMRNLTPRYAVGGSLTLGTGGTHPITGVRLRGRRWLNQNLGAELGAGFVRTHGSRTPFPLAASGSVDVRLNLRDRGSTFLRWDAGPEHGISWGAGLGSTPALVATGVTAVVAAVAVALALSET